MSSTGVTRIEGVDPYVAMKAPCVVATTTNITLSGAQTIDGIAVAATTIPTRVLVRAQTIASENGVYDVSGTAWIRSEDFDGNRDIVRGTLVSVNEGGGTINGTTFKVTSPDPIVINTSDIIFNVANAVDVIAVVGTSATDTFAKMRALPSGVYSPGDVIRSTGDFIDGEFRVVDATVTDDAFSLIVFDDDLSRHLKRIYNGRVTGGMFGLKGDGTDETALFVTAATFASVNAIDFVFDGFYTVTKVLLDGLNGGTWTGVGGLVGTATGTRDAILELFNCSAIKVRGNISLNGVSNNGYGVACLAWTDGVAACNYNDLAFGAIANVRRSIQFGKPSEPDWAISENTISGNTYLFNVAQGVYAYGAQCVLLVDGLINSVKVGTFAVDAVNVFAMGALVIIRGGEMLNALGTVGQVCIAEPIVSATYGNQYGNIHISDCEIEDAVPLFNAINTLGTASPVGGSFKVHNCTGKHTQNLVAFIEATPDFPGYISVTKCSFAATSARTQKNIVAGANCRITYDAESFGANMLQGDNGLTGGIPFFEKKMILDANNTSSNTTLSAVAGENVIFSAFDTTGNDLTYHASTYAAGTSIFTIPVGGLEDITVKLPLKVDITAVTINIELDGAVGRSTLMRGLNEQVEWNFAYLAAGTTINVSTSSAGAGLKTGGAQDRFQIFAARKSIH